MVRQVTTYYCENCGAGYSSFALAQHCEASACAALRQGDVILRSAPADDVFEVERDALVWGIVSSVTSTPGCEETPRHRHFYTTSGLSRDIEETDLEFATQGHLGMERGLLEGPAHTRQLSVLMDTYAEIRNQMADSFQVLSQLTGLISLTPESYAKWDDLRYTVYDFGLVDGDAPAMLPPECVSLLQWCAEPRPASSMHAALFEKPMYGLHGGPGVYASFDDNVGLRTKWLVGRGDPYRYLRFHMQPVEAQREELSALQAAVLSGQGQWFDRLQDLFVVKDTPGPVPPEVRTWTLQRGIEGSSPDIADALFRWLVQQQEGWRHAVTVTPKIVPTDIPVIAVAAGKGGVGKSTVAAHLARSLAEDGMRPLFLDLDFYGPSAPIEFGLSDPLRIEDGYIVPHQVSGVGVVSVGNMIPSDRALHWRGPVLEAFIHLITAHIRYDDVDVIVLDCPPGTGDVQLGIYNRVMPEGTLLVTTGSELAIADVRRALASFRAAGVRVIGVVENMSEVRFQDGQVRRLFGTRDRVEAFCREEDLRWLGSIPFADTEDELHDSVRDATRDVWSMVGTK